MTKQEVFDRVKAHLLTQNRRSTIHSAAFSSYEKCAYRGTDGLKCAVGCLIEDEFYTPDMESLGVSTGKIKHAVMASLKLTSDEYYQLVTILEDLQEVHDRDVPNNWKDALVNVANLHRLNSGLT